MKSAHLPFDSLMALSGSTSSPPRVKSRGKAEGLRYPHPSSLRRTVLYASLIGISGALHLNAFDQPAQDIYFGNLNLKYHLLLL
jgi:hypothetical protein